VRCGGGRIDVQIGTGDARALMRLKRMRRDDSEELRTDDEAESQSRKNLTHGGLQLQT
jgi:hypothetical protein